MDREPITEEEVRGLLLGVDRTSDERYLGAFGSYPELDQWAYDNGFQITGWAQENAVSGATNVVLRDGFVDAIRTVRDDPRYTGIICPSTERLARDQTAFEVLSNAMRQASRRLFVAVRDDHGRLLEVLDVTDRETPHQRWERQVRELKAIEARLILKRDAERARVAKIARGGYGGGFLRPAWFMDRVDLGDGKAEFTPNPTRLQWALWMIDRRAEGWTYPEIADELERHGLRTAGGKRFQPNRIAEVLGQIRRVPDDVLAAWTAPPGSSPSVDIAQSTVAQATKPLSKIPANVYPAES